MSRLTEIVFYLFHTHRLDMLEKIGWKIAYLKPIQVPGRVIERYTHTLLKLHAWNMTEYDAIAIIDADAMLIGSIEEPFRFLRANENISLLAVYDSVENELKNKDKSKHSCFNSGILFYGQILNILKNSFVFRWIQHIMT